MFPIYIWVIIGLIILASHFSHRFTKLLHGQQPSFCLGNAHDHPPLTDTKILRTLIAALYVTYLEYPTYNRGVWLYDANIDYFRTEHIPVLVFLFLFVPYTLLLLFGQWLQAISHLRLFAWVNSAEAEVFHGFIPCSLQGKTPLLARTAACASLYSSSSLRPQSSARP